jgi:hypothetical protein
MLLHLSAKQIVNASFVYLANGQAGPSLSLWLKKANPPDVTWN